MKIEVDSLKISLTQEEVKKLVVELNSMINDIKYGSEHFSGYFDETEFREKHPKINEFFSILKVNINDLPF
jgi:hypothetical protein